MSDRLKKYQDIWKKKKILRVVYIGWYKKILKDLKLDSKKTVELGSGSGNFKEFKPDVISSDIENCEWLDMCFDAHNMPFDDNSVSNFVMIDVLHHLSDPIKFLKEAGRVLEKDGKVIIIEPYPTPFSYLIYHIFHPEPFLMNIDYCNRKKLTEKDPWDSNQAIAYLLFYKNKKKLIKKIGHQFKIVKKHKMSCILYPASGGFENRAMIPDFFIPLFQLLEIMLTPLRWLLAFRCYIVIEKIT